MKLKIDRAWIRQKTLEEEGYEIGAGSYLHPLRQPEMIMKLQAAIDKLKFLQPGLENSNSAAEDALVDFLPDLIKLLEQTATPQSGWRPIETLKYDDAAHHFLIKAPSLAHEDFNPDGVSLACFVIDDESVPLASCYWNASHDCYMSCEVSDATDWMPVFLGGDHA